MVTIAPQARPPQKEGFRRFGFTRLGADLLYVLPGFFLSTFAFVLLVTLFAVSVSTLIVWVGLALLPLTLLLASGFADLSRMRLRHWGPAIPKAQYRQKGPGARGYLSWIADPRRWVDLVFETIIAFPLRVFTFCIAVTWIACALGGLSWWSWGFYLPDGEPRLPGRILEALTDGAIPDALSHSYALESACYLVLGIVFAASLPFVMRGLAWIDALATMAALGEELSFAADADPAAAFAARRTVGIAGETAEPHPAPAGVAGTAGSVSAPVGRPEEDKSAVSVTGWAWIFAAFVSVVAVAAGWPVLAAVHGVPVVIAMLIVLAQVGALLLSVRGTARNPEGDDPGGMRWIVASIGLALLAPTALAFTNFWDSTFVLPWPVTMLIVQACLVLLVALRAPWIFAIASWFLPLAASVLSFLLIRRTGVLLPAASAENIVVCAAISAGIGVIGVVIRLLWRSRSGLAAERLQSATLSAEKSELAERNRIARELHDVVAHSMSVISVQATTAKYRLDDLDDSTQEEFRQIADSSRQALTEMRGLLGVLRADDAAPLAPQPGFEDIPALVEASRQSGARIILRQEGNAAVPAATGLTAYRAVQEGLSNAVRHAPGAEIEVFLSLAERLILVIRNGAGDPSLGADAAPGAGLGLAGIRDRVTALGGTVAASPQPDGGHLLQVALPLV